MHQFHGSKKPFVIFVLFYIKYVADFFTTGHNHIAIYKVMPLKLYQQDHYTKTISKNLLFRRQKCIKFM